MMCGAVNVATLHCYVLHDTRKLMTTFLHFEKHLETHSTLCLLIVIVLTLLGNFSFLFSSTRTISP